MFKKVGLMALASGMLLLAACAPKPVPTINESMTKVMQPKAQVIWDITSGAFNEKGDGLVADKISQDQWNQLAEAGQQIRDRAELLGNARRVTVATPGEAIMGGYASHAGAKGTWDAASIQQVQAAIDANPVLFKKRMKILEDAGDTVVKASGAKNAAMLYGVSANLDEVCDGCHQPFWGTDEPPPFPH